MVPQILFWTASLKYQIRCPQFLLVINSQPWLYELRSKTMFRFQNHSAVTRLVLETICAAFSDSKQWPRGSYYFQWQRHSKRGVSCLNNAYSLCWLFCLGPTLNIHMGLQLWPSTRLVNECNEGLPDNSPYSYWQSKQYLADNYNTCSPKNIFQWKWQTWWLRPERWSS